MTQEEKDLLLRDLCSRLPYGVKVHAKYIDTITDVEVEKDGVLSMVDNDTIIAFTCDDTNCYNYVAIHEIKPYLLPITSMTAEQREEYRKVCELDTEILSKHPMDGSPFPAMYNSQDWLDANNFDYRGLIPRLAIDATGKDIY